MASRCTAAARAIRILLVDDTESVRRALRLILSRIKEAIDRGATNDAAVSEGIKATAGTVTNAATIMVGVFAVFAMLRVLELKEVGVGLGVAVLLPASMKLLGNANWYLPSWLGWLPHLTIESPAVIDEQSAPATEREYAYAD